jgi:hypothetical protein
MMLRKQSNSVVSAAAADEEEVARLTASLTTLLQAELKEKKMKDKVDEVLKSNLRVPEDRLHEVSCCLKRAIYLGHYDSLTPPWSPSSPPLFSLDTILVKKPTCKFCFARLPMNNITVESVLYQIDISPATPSSRFDEDGVGFCEECGDMNFVTGICNGKPIIVTDKIHHHCKLCPDFGCCKYDRWSIHCESCGSHFFVNDDCPNCGRN